MILFLLNLGIAEEYGTITGVVRDQATQQALPGTNVILEETGLGTAAGENGKFIIRNVPVGFYHVRFSFMGYQPLVRLNVRVVPNRTAHVKAVLIPAVLDMEGVTVTRAYYQKEKDAVVSSRTVDFEEIRRDPAGSYDIQRMMQALPSVVSATDQQNEIVVRGGAPGENLFIMDNIEIDNPNHFGIQGSGGGPINMINTLFIDRVDFLAGAFPAKYGDKASSVMDIELREGSRQNHSQDLEMGMAGIGVFAEGPIANGRGSYMASYRKSYLDLIIANTGLTAVPHYWNLQSKLAFDINPTNKLLVNVVHGVDAIKLEGENNAWSRGADNVDVGGNQSVFGATYKRLWSNNGLSRFTIGGTRAQFIYDVYRLDGAGEKQQYYEQDDTEWDLQVKSDFVWRVSSSLELSGGLEWKQMGGDFNKWADRDTLWIWAYNYPALGDSFAVISRSEWQENVLPIVNNADPDSVYLDENDVWYYGRETAENNWEWVRVRKTSAEQDYDGLDQNRGETFPRYGGFAQVKWRPVNRLILNIGLRAGYFEFTDYSWLAPRLGLTWNLNNRTAINAAYGRHYQHPYRNVLMFDVANEDLNSKFNDQVVLGVEHYFAEDTRGTIEAYWKEYQDIPIPVSMTTLDSLDRSNRYVNSLKSKSYGIELFLQKKLAQDFFGTFSYSWYRALGKDPRYPEKNEWFSRTFDFQHVLTAVGGYKIPMTGPGAIPLENRNWLVRLMGKTIGAGADELEFSFRYRYVGGKPYSPQRYDHNLRQWFPAAEADFNTDRFKPYHRFDIMILWHVRFKRFNMISYFDLQNVTNRDNIWDIQYNPDGTTDWIYQYKVFPVGGFTLEF